MVHTRCTDLTLEDNLHHRNVGMALLNQAGALTLDLQTTKGLLTIESRMDHTVHS